VKISFILLIVPLLFIVLSGCATGPKYTEVESSFDALEPGKGRIFIYRPSSFGAAIQPKVRLDGEVVGKAKPHGFFFIDKAPGEYEIVTSTEVERSLSLTLDEGETRYVRLSVSMGFMVGHVYPELVEPSMALEEIQALSYMRNPVEEDED
jgi:hypothetical protein